MREPSVRDLLRHRLDLTLAVDATSGALTKTDAQPAGHGPTAIAIHPAGRFLYHVNEIGSTVRGYARDRVNGRLTPMGAWTCGSLPFGITIDRRGRFLYVVNSHDETISQFAICAATGDLRHLRDTAAPRGPGQLALL